MTLQQIVKNGRTLQYTEQYNCTMMGCEQREVDLPCPRALKRLTTQHPDAKIIIYGDETLGIAINGRVWRVEEPHHDMRPYKTLQAVVWQYLNAAIPGRRQYADRMLV